MTNIRKTSSAEFKVEAVKLILDGNQTIAETTARLGIGLSTLTRWESNYLTANHQAKIAFPGKGKLSPHDAELKAL